MGISASYFDGRTSRRHAVEFTVDGDTAVLTGDIERRCPLGDLRVSERTRHVPRKVTFPDGAYLEGMDAAQFDSLLSDTGHRDSLVVRLQQSWRATLIACAATLALLGIGYVYVLPAAAGAIARTLPESVERSIGRGALQLLDERLLAPSALPAQRRQAIAERFRSLTPARDGAPSFELLFRKSRIGPNAFALPSGQIVLTDDIVDLLKDDDAVVAVLAHELGHLHERHLLQRVVQSSLVGTVALLIGDASSIAASLPVLMLELKYSRDAEREADDYAMAMLSANGIPLAALIRAFEKLGERGADPPPYLTSHPTTEERIERIRRRQ